MKLTYGSSLILTSATTLYAAKLPACSSQPYKAAALLSSYAPAQSFCTKSFPLPRVTTTSTAAAITLTSTAAATTQTVTGAAAVSTITELPVITVTTEVVTSTSIGTVNTETVWVTETEAPRRRKKRAAVTTTNSALSSFWSSISSRGSATLSTLCACIGTPATTTTTITPKTTVGTTPTVYATTAPISLVTVTPTSTSTFTSVDIIVETESTTITSTTTVTPTATSTPSPVRDCQRLSDANQGIYSGFKLACNNDNAGGIDLFGEPADTFSDCLALCAQRSGCKGVTYVGEVKDFQSNMCYGKERTGLWPDARFDSAYLPAEL